MTKFVELERIICGTKDKVIINTENINFISVEENYVSVGGSGIILSVESIKRLIDILKESDKE